MLKIVYMGSPEFAIPGLEAIHRSLHTVQAVISSSDKRRGRGEKASPTPLKRRALELGYDVHTFESTSDPELASLLRLLRPDLIVVVAFRILPPGILDIPRLGAINLHASLLPKYRGAAPIHRAIINGEAETGCSVFFLQERVDAGNVILQSRTRIGPDETTGDLYDRLKSMGAELLVEAIDQIASGEVEGVPQRDEEASPSPKVFAEDGRIDFLKPSRQVHNLIRGMSPFPGAWAMYGNHRMTIYRSRLGPDIDLEPGKMEFVEGRLLLVGCAEGSVELRELQLPGKNRISGADFANGYNLKVPLA